MNCQRRSNAFRAGRLFSTVASVCTLFNVSLAIGWEGVEDAAPAQDVWRAPETETALRHRFAPADEALLDEIQHGCFLYFWKEVGQPACLAKDRKLAPVASIAAVGFQLASLPVGVERKWITRAQGEQRAATVLQSLIERTDNKRDGVYLHFPDHNTGGFSDTGYISEASTVDHGLLMAGALVAASHFGGDVARWTDRLVAETNWRSYAVAKDGLLTMGWLPEKGARTLTGDGKYIAPHHWWNASDEERLIYFLATGNPQPEHATPPELYYKLSRTLKSHAGMPPFVVSWPGNLFTYFFAHLYIDWRGFEADNPKSFGIDQPRVDWFENSRRAVLTHRRRCIEESQRYKTLSAERWGLAPCAARDGYIVPDTSPNLSGQDQWFEGTISPYAAGASITFTPPESLVALRAFRAMDGSKGTLPVWRDPQQGGYGLVDSFNLDQKFASDDYTGIDEGPLLLAIENARTGLIWKLFMQHDVARRAVERLRWK